MPWGEAAAEQHEKDQPSTCLRPDGAGPELPPLLGRNDFLERIEVVGDAIAEHRMCQIHASGGGRESYHAERQRAAEAKADQLVLMRARQIVEEADERRRKVQERARLIRPPHPHADGGTVFEV